MAGVAEQRPAAAAARQDPLRQRVAERAGDLATAASGWDVATNAWMSPEDRAEAAWRAGLALGVVLLLTFVVTGHGLGATGFKFFEDVFPLVGGTFLRGSRNPAATIELSSASSYESPKHATSPVEDISTRPRGSAPLMRR